MRSPRSLARVLLAVLAIVAQSACLGTVIETPARASRSYSKLQIHVIAAPSVLRAEHCELGISDIFNYVPLWGLAVGILTFGILVPARTVYSCVAPSPSAAP